MKIVNIEKENVHISLFAASKYQKLMKIVNIEKENVHIFRTSSGISMKFSEKM